MLATLTASGKYKGRFTTDDVNKFVKEGCGACESAKMNRRSFTIATIEDKTLAPVGKKWQFDSLKLRVSAAHHGFLHIGRFVCSTSKKKRPFGMLGLTTDDLKLVYQRMQARERAKHGDIWIVRADSHPTHRGQALKDFLAQRGTHNPLSPPYVHEGVTDCEGCFLRIVPNAMALLHCAPDFGEEHFFSAFLTACAAADQVAILGTDPLVCIDMKYEERTEWRPNPLLGYGSPAKALVHPEARDSKYESHSFACVYAGPAHASDSLVHCAVWHDHEYTDVDLGCLNIDERIVVARMQRNHPSHQPYGQDGTVPKDPVANTQQWYDAANERHPVDVKRQDVLTELPTDNTASWCSADTVTELFTLGICSGVAREGDTSAWINQLTGGKLRHIRIDIKHGGHEQNILLPRVLDSLVKLAGQGNCLGVSLELACGKFSASRFAKAVQPNDPQPVFTTDEPDGVKDAGGKLLHAASIGMQMVDAGIAIAEACLGKGGFLIAEHPAGQGLGTLHASKGLEKHSTMFDTTAFKDEHLRVVVDWLVTG